MPSPAIRKLSNARYIEKALGWGRPRERRKRGNPKAVAARLLRLASQRARQGYSGNLNTSGR